MGAGIQAAALPAARERGEVQGGKAERERAGTVAPSGAGGLLLPEIEEAAGEHGLVVVIAGALKPAHRASIAQAVTAAAPSLTWPAPRTMLGP